MDPEPALRLSAAIAAIAATVASIEILSSRRDYEAGGVFDRSLLSGRRVWLGPKCVSTAAAARVLAAFVLLVPTAPFWAVGAAATVVLTLGVVLARLAPHGADGADQILKMVLASVAIAAVGGSPRLGQAGVVFTAAQACLAYATGGGYKAASPQWRSGTALVGIASVDVLGHPRMRDWLEAHPLWPRPLAWAVIAWECTFPLVLIAPLWLLLPWLAIGVAFHAASAFGLGLNTFFWSFLSTYPAIVYSNGLFRSWL